MANPSVCLSSVTCVHPTQGFNFRAYCALYCSLAIRQLTHQKSRRSPKGIILSEQISLTGVWLCDSSNITNKQEGGCSNRRIWHIAAYAILLSCHVWIFISRRDEFLVRLLLPSVDHPHLPKSLNQRSVISLCISLPLK